MDRVSLGVKFPDSTVSIVQYVNRPLRPHSHPCGRPEDPGEPLGQEMRGIFVFVLAHPGDQHSQAAPLNPNRGCGEGDHPLDVFIFEIRLLIRLRLKVHRQPGNRNPFFPIHPFKSRAVDKPLGDECRPACSLPRNRDLGKRYRLSPADAPRKAHLFEKNQPPFIRQGRFPVEIIGPGPSDIGCRHLIFLPGTEAFRSGN